MARTSTSPCNSAPRSPMKTPTTVAVLVTGLALLAGTGAAADTPRPGPVTPPPRISTDPASTQFPTGVVPVTDHSLPPTATVTLPTGDRVRLDTTPDGRQSIVPAGANPAAGATLVRFSWHGDEYAVPTTAVPFLSSTLDPRLFDVSYLVRAKLDDAHSATLPLAVTRSTAGTALPAVGAGDALAKSQAGAFGQLLASRWKQATLTGVTTVALAPPAGAPALPSAPPRSAAAGAKPAASGPHYRTLTVKFIDRNGNPGTALGWVQNVDDARLGVTLFGSLPAGDGGPASFSVPDGNYNLAFSILTPHADNSRFDVALAVKPQVKVGSDLTITLDARIAVQYKVAVDPAVTATTEVDRLDVTRTSATGGGVATRGFLGVGMGLLSFDGPGATSPSDKLLVTPTGTVSKGVFGWDASSVVYTQDPPTDPSVTPRYVLNFSHAGSIPATQSHTVRAADLTAVHERLYTSLGSTASCGFSRELFPIVYQPWGTYQELGYAGWDDLAAGAH